MTSTPVSLDESVNGSWCDITSASQVPSPMDDFISFQVERFLQEAQRNQNATSNSQLSLAQQAAQETISMYSSDSDVSVDGVEGKALVRSLHRNQRLQRIQHLHQQEQQNQQNNFPGSNNNDPHSTDHPMNTYTSQRLSKSGDCLADQLSDSLSLLSRASALGEPSLERAADFQDFDWLWDWTAQPEYFSGQEWKVYAPKQDYLMRQRRLYCATNLDKSHGNNLFSGEVISLLFLTNILSIIIGAGLTYSILMRRSIV